MVLPGLAGDTEGRMSRHAFLIRLGGGAAGAIAGYLAGVALDSELARPAPGDHAPGLVRPALRDGLRFGFADGFHTLAPAASSGGSVCAMNAVGKFVAERLDGRASIADLGRAVAGRFGLVHDDGLEAGIALFISHLAQVGFLTASFYVTLYEEREGHE
ncbi:MAG: PqqD family protein [Candidatus Hydrogenedentes bacterium]|nr:PqqD family protein [Candidatus Hydrogenedentota bacterium]